MATIPVLQPTKNKGESVVGDNAFGARLRDLGYEFKACESHTESMPRKTTLIAPNVMKIPRHLNFNHVLLIGCLILLGCSPERTDETPRNGTPIERFFAAVVAGNAKEVGDLLASDPTLVNQPSPNPADRNRRALHLAQNGAVARLLLANGAEVSALDKLDYTPLHTALSGEIVDLLVENGADIEAQAKGRKRPMHTISEVDAIRALVRHGAELNPDIDRGHAPIRDHVREDHVEIVAFLLKAGAAKDHEKYRYRTDTWLHLAAQHAGPGMIEVLVKQGGQKVNAPKASTKATPLHLAVLNDRVAVARKLLELGADPSLELDEDARISQFAGFVGHNAPEIEDRTSFGIVQSAEMKDLLEQYR